MKKILCFFVVIALLILIIGCDGNDNDIGNSNKTVTTASESQVNLLTTKDQIKSGDSVFEVTNYKELLDAIGSDREIQLLPGDYDSSNFGMSNATFANISNLTIIGKSDLANKHLDYSTSNAGQILSFTNCNNIKLVNLNIKRVKELDNQGYFSSFVSFYDSNKIIIDNCKIDAFNSEAIGLSLGNVKDFKCTNSIIEGSTEAPVEIKLSERVEFMDSILKGGPLHIGEEIDNTMNKDIVFRNCSLINEEGICSTWSNYVPTSEDSGYEIDFGTEEWNESRLLSAIKYINNKNDWYGLTYEDTYDGNAEIYSDGKFNKLADKLKKVKNNLVFLSIDYIRDYETGIIKSKTLNINILEDNLANANVNSMIERISQLNAVKSDIIEFSWPINVVYRSGKEPKKIIAAAEFSSKSFKEYLSDSNNTNIDKYSNVKLDIHSSISAAKFYKIKVKEAESKVVKDIQGTLLSKDSKIQEDYRQQSKILFTSKSKEGYYYVTALESLVAIGDFMHYSTDLIVKTNALTGDRFIAEEDKSYRILPDKELKNKSTFSKAIFDGLSKLPNNLKKQIEGKYSKDVLVFLEDDNKKYVSFLFLAVNHTSDDSFYYHNYYIGKMDVDSKKITDITPVSLVDFKDICN